MNELTLEEYKNIDESILMLCTEYIGDNANTILLIKDIPSAHMVNGDTGIEFYIHEGPADLSKINPNELSKLFGKQLFFMMLCPNKMEELANILLRKSDEIRNKMDSK